MTPVWRVQLLGGLSARHHDETLTGFATHKVASLLAFLAYNPHRRHTREDLFKMFWPDCEPADGRNRLSTLLTELRHLLEPPGIPRGAVVVADRNSVSLNPDTLTTDVAQFQHLLQRAKKEPESEARLRWLQQATALYQGELLPGRDEDWVLGERERLTQAYLQGLHHLAECELQSGSLQAALAATQTALSVDASLEPTCQLQMQVYAALGQPLSASQSYQTLQQRLKESGVLPSAQTAALREEILYQPRSVVRVRQVPPSSQQESKPPSTVGPSQDATEGSASASAANNAPLPLSLPLQLTRFFGREVQIEQLREHLLGREPRLLTLTGPGGVGKTRLAIEAARTVAEAFEGRIWFVDLAGLPDGRVLPSALANELHLTLSPQSDPLEQVVGKLNEGPSLLLLDNFEHLLREEPGRFKGEGESSGRGSVLLVRLLLERAPALKCVVTSRQPLHIGGEQEFTVPTLPVPGNEGRGKSSGVQVFRSPGVGKLRSDMDLNTRTPEHLNTLLAFPSVALYVDRARASRSDFTLTANNAEAVARLCGKLEGMPLALEMAAAWIKTVAPQKMLERLERQLDALVSRLRDVPARQRSLRATLEWSYELLDPSLQRLFARLSVFRGGWSVEAAEQVCSNEHEPPAIQNPKSKIQNEKVLDLLCELVDRSLVMVEATGRYRMLESVRECAEEKLTQSGEREVLQRRYADYFVALAEEAGAHLQWSQQTQWFEVLETEYTNLRAVLAWSQQTKVDGSLPSKYGLRLVVALWWFWHVRGYLSEGRGHLAQALASALSAPPALRAKALGGAGCLAMFQGDYPSARGLHEQSLSIYRDLGDRYGIAGSLGNLGILACNQSDYATARALYAESLAILRELGDRQGIASSLVNLGNLAYYQGDYVAARAAHEENLSIVREFGDRRGIAISLNTLGSVAHSQSDYALAHTLYDESLSIHRELGDTRGIAISLNNLGEVAYYQGDYPSARALHTESLSIRRELGDWQGIAQSMGCLGNLACVQRDYHSARALYEESLSHYRELGHRGGIAESLNNLGGLAQELGDYGAARVSYQESLKIEQELGQKHEIGPLLASFASLATAMGKRERAARLFGAASLLLETVNAFLSPIRRARFERDLDAARTMMGEAFTDAWDRGRAMTLEQAIEYALQHTDT